MAPPFRLLFALLKINIISSTLAMPLYIPISTPSFGFKDFYIILNSVQKLRNVCLSSQPGIRLLFWGQPLSHPSTEGSRPNPAPLLSSCDKHTQYGFPLLGFIFPSVASFPLYVFIRIYTANLWMPVNTNNPLV